MKKIIKTKEQLIKEVAVAEARINGLDARDARLRDQFTKVLTHEVSSRSIYPHSSRPETMSWEQIFFTVGELNSDADYSIMLSEKHRLQGENEDLKHQIKRLKEGRPQ